MSWFDSYVTPFVRGAVAAFTDDDLTARTHVPDGAVFRNWVQQLAPHFGAEIHWDEDGSATVGLVIRMNGSTRLVFLALDNGSINLSAPSNIKFRPGFLPPDVATYLSQRNAKLEYMQWGTFENSERSYFMLRSGGRMHKLNVDALKLVIDKMIVESYALDMTLQQEGYA